MVGSERRIEPPQRLPYRIIVSAAARGLKVPICFLASPRAVLLACLFPSEVFVRDRLGAPLAFVAFLTTLYGRAQAADFGHEGPN